MCRILLFPSDKCQYPLSLFHNAVVAAGVDMEFDEVQCMLANMVFKVRFGPSVVTFTHYCNSSVAAVKRQLRGYISHGLKTLVTAKTDVFPKMST